MGILWYFRKVQSCWLGSTKFDIGYSLMFLQMKISFLQWVLSIKNNDLRIFSFMVTGVVNNNRSEKLLWKDLVKKVDFYFFNLATTQNLLKKWPFHSDYNFKGLHSLLLSKPLKLHSGLIKILCIFGCGTINNKSKKHNHPSICLTKCIKLHFLV